ncbi:MAG: hypothetical protein GKR86_09345 [Ilumatobacter sp.]|nr:hypothetical protein [Ilumatobacter sp.]
MGTPARGADGSPAYGPGQPRHHGDRII